MTVTGKTEIWHLSDYESDDRANKIMAKNIENGYRQVAYKGYKYYRENPSLAINEIIEKILKECELL